MARPSPLADRLADALVALLAGISAISDPTRWLTTPRTVKRGAAALALTIEPRPALVLEVAEVTFRPLAALVHEQEVGFEVWCAVDDAEEPERALLALAADVQQALTADESLIGLALEPFEGTYRPRAQLSGGGIALASVSFSVRARYDHSLTAMP